MPWDNSELWLAEIRSGGTLGKPVRVAGGRSESVFQPQWSPAGHLYFVSDRSNWWNLYRYDNGRIDGVLEKAAEFGLPMWTFGMSTYAFKDVDSLFCTFFEDHRWKLAVLTISSSQCRTYDDLPFTEVSGIRANAGLVYFLAGAPNLPTSVIALDPETGRFRILRKSANFGFL